MPCRSLCWRTELSAAEPLTAAVRGRKTGPVQPSSGVVSSAMIRASLLAATSLILLASAAPAAAPPFNTPAPVVYLIDLSSGAVLLEKDADRRMPPASMAKMMTTNVAFELIKKGDLK